MRGGEGQNQCACVCAHVCMSQTRTSHMQAPHRQWQQRRSITRLVCHQPIPHYRGLLVLLVAPSSPLQLLSFSSVGTAWKTWSFGERMEGKARQPRAELGCMGWGATRSQTNPWPDAGERKASLSDESSFTKDKGIWFPGCEIYSWLYIVCQQGMNFFYRPTSCKIKWYNMP